jgi:Neurotransmitter-gated ion-channel ligand binding domain
VISFQDCCNSFLSLHVPTTKCISEFTNFFSRHSCESISIRARYDAFHSDLQTTKLHKFQCSALPKSNFTSSRHIARSPLVCQRFIIKSNFRSAGRIQVSIKLNFLLFLPFPARFVVDVCTVCAGNPDAKRLYDDLLSNYNKLVRPVVNVTDALTVRIKLKLSQLIDVVRALLCRIPRLTSLSDISRSCQAIANKSCALT